MPEQAAGRVDIPAEIRRMPSLRPLAAARRRPIARGGIAAAWLLLAPATLAVAQTPPSTSGTPSAPGVPAGPLVPKAPAASVPAEEQPENFLTDDKIKRLIRDAVRDTSFRYTLDDRQRQVAREIIEENSRKFFERRQEEIRSLQLEADKIRQSGDEDPEKMKEMARRFADIFGDLRKTIDETGDEFHKILTPEQAKDHDADRALVKSFLDGVESLNNQTLADGLTPWTPARLADGRAGADASGRRKRWNGGGLLEREWEAYAAAMAAHFRFDEGQVAKAGEMLSAAKRDAAAYRKDRLREFAELADAHKRLNEVEEAVRAGEFPPEARAGIAEQRKRLDADVETFEKPLHEMFAKLREALDTLPTAEQRKKAGPFGRKGK
jgi:hypothetical protein